MWNCWKIFWASLGRGFTVLDVVTESGEIAAKEGLSEVEEWAEINQLSRRTRVNAARALRQLPPKTYADEEAKAA